MNFLSQSKYIAFLVLVPVLAQAEGLKPMRGLRPTSFWEVNWAWLLPVLVALGLGAIGAVVWFVSRKPAVPPLTPAEEARVRLGDAADLADGQDDKAFSVSVSDALRQYLEKRFELRAPEQTTEEFLQSAKASDRLPAESLDTLGKFLEFCDLAKFAQHAFGNEERQELLNTARSFVDEAERPKVFMKEVATV
ncbi:MAG: hypothetical protein AAFX93_03130 [Verrucomicrobiota bacterium]